MKLCKSDAEFTHPFKLKPSVRAAALLLRAAVRLLDAARLRGHDRHVRQDRGRGQRVARGQEQFQVTDDVAAVWLISPNLKI